AGARLVGRGAGSHARARAREPAPVSPRGVRAVKAVILAGGKGRRLAPLTVAFPKPLVPVGDRAVLEILIRSLVASGITEIVLSVDHLAELIMAYVEGHPELRTLARYRFVRDREPGGTAGPLARIEGLDEGTFLVTNGDLLTSLDFRALLEH